MDADAAELETAGLSARTPVSTFAGACLWPDLTALVSLDGRFAFFRSLTNVFDDADFGSPLLTMLFPVARLTRFAAALAAFRFFLGAAFAAGLAATFFRGLVFAFVARFRGPAEDDPPPGRFRVDLADVVFFDLAPLAFAGFLVDFLRAAIKLSTQDRLRAPL